MSGKPCGVEEARQLVSLADQRIAIRSVLVQTRPAADKIRMLKFRSAGAEKTAAAEEGVLSWKALRLDDVRKTVDWGGQRITLTNREFLMLKTLLENRDIVLSRETLLDRVCGYDYVGETNIVDVYVRHLRAKIDEVYGVKMLETVRGAGYVIRSE